MQGKLIVFEGVEGSGKTTQLQRLYNALNASPLFYRLKDLGQVKQIIHTREPGGTALGKTLREILLEGSAEVHPQHRAELLLYAADRAQHVEELLLPALRAGCWVLCDRYVDSTVAYQGYGRGLDLNLIDQLNQIATGGLMGDLTLWFDIEAEAGLVRTQQRGQADRMEQTEIAFHRRVQRGFEALAGAHPERIVAIDARPDADTVAHKVQRQVEKSIEQWYAPFLTA